MKKYHRLFIFAVALVSLIGFIFYRSEYLRLRSIFEIGDLFSSDSFVKDCIALNDTVLHKAEYSNLFSRPSPQWMKINNFFVFSAFWRDLTENSKSIAIGVSSKENDFSKYGCHVWYHLRGSLFSISGKFSYTSIQLNKSVFYNEFFCVINNDDLKGLPYMFVFIDETENRKYFVPIFYKPQNERSGHAGVCVFPDIEGLERNNIIEFISYHKEVGFTDIIFYDNGIQHGIVKLLEDTLPNINFLRSFSTLNWQFPFGDLEAQEEFIKRDCIYRIFDQVDLVIFLHWDEYIIPRTGKSIPSLFSHLDDKKSFQFSFQTQRCCTELQSDKRAKQSWPVMLKKTLCTKQLTNKTILLNPSPFSDLENVPSSKAVINSYDSCEMLKNTNIFQDKTALKFISNLMSNDLLRVSRSGIFNQINIY